MRCREHGPADRRAYRAYWRRRLVPPLHAGRDGGAWHIIDPDGREVDTALCGPHLRSLWEMGATLHEGWIRAWPIQPATPAGAVRAGCGA